MGTHLKKLRWFGLVGAGVVVVASVVIFAVASSGDPAPPQSLGEIRGFGGGAEGRLADDTIALWEAFSREEHVQDCMSRAGLDYTIDVVFPKAEVVAVADSLGIVAADDSRGNGAQGLASETSGSGGAQQGLLDDLMTSDVSPVPAVESDQYFMALYGETAADVAYVESTGFLPEGRNDFARGGCYGASWDAIPGLYELRREISGEVREAKATEMAAALPCVTPNGVRLAGLREMEEAMITAFDSGESPADIDEIAVDLESCGPALERENAAASERARATVFARHRQRLLRQDERYGSIIDDHIESDRPFEEYLQGALAQIEYEAQIEDEQHTHSP